MGTCKKITKFVPVIVAWTLLLATTVLFFLYPCQFLQHKYHVSIVIFQGVISLFVFSNFFLATFSDPGIIPKANREEDDDDLSAPLFKSVEINGIQVRMKWCITCKFYRPPRCSHCSECNTCIETFDHHCPWMNNCIGRRNYRHFFFFLIFLSIHMITVFVWCVFYILNNKERLYEPESIVSLALMTLIILLIIPIVGLTIFHIFIVSTGRTTNEQITGKFERGLNPFTRGCLLNWCFTLCGPKYPKYELSRKNKEFFLNLGANSNDTLLNDKLVRVYLDNEDKSLIQKKSINKNHQYVYSKSNENNLGSTLNSSLTNENAVKNEKIDIVLESISRDCEPSPPTTLKSQNADWQKRVQNHNNSHSKSNNYNSYGAPALTSYNYNSPNNINQLTSSQSQVLYSQHYPMPVRKLDNVASHHLIANSPQTANSYDHTTNTEIGLHLISQPGSHLINHPNFYHQFNTRSVSPAKNSSIGEMSPFAHYNMSSKPLLQSHNKLNGATNTANQQSGVVVYYRSPEKTDNSLMITDLDSVGSKFASETELPKLKERLAYNSPDANRSSDPHNQPSNSNKKSFFSKRPMSFKKALEITEQFEKERHSHLPNNRMKGVAAGSNKQVSTNSDGTTANAGGVAASGTTSKDAKKEDNRHSQYEMNYEISV